MNTPTIHSLTGLEKDIIAKGRITADDVLELRRAVYQDGEVQKDEADFIFRLNRACPDADPAWDTFYVEALGDFFYWQREAGSVLSEADSQYLISWITEDGTIADRNELKLLVNIMARAQGTPEPLKVFVLKAIKASVLTSDQAIYGDRPRHPGVIDQDDITVIKKVIYGLASEGGIGISRDEAELLFALNNETDPDANEPEWRQLFVKAVAMHLLYRGDSPEMIDEDEAQWLADQVDRGRPDHRNEIALLDYVIKEAQMAHPLVADLREKLTQAQAAA